jgi:hypothetical protein
MSANIGPKSYATPAGPPNSLAAAQSGLCINVSPVNAKVTVMGSGVATVDVVTAGFDDAGPVVTTGVESSTVRDPPDEHVEAIRHMAIQTDRRM